MMLLLRVKEKKEGLKVETPQYSVYSGCTDTRGTEGKWIDSIMVLIKRRKRRGERRRRKRTGLHSSRSRER